MKLRIIAFTIALAISARAQQYVGWLGYQQVATPTVPAGIVTFWQDTSGVTHITSSTGDILAINSSGTITIGGSGTSTVNGAASSDLDLNAGTGNQNVVLTPSGTGQAKVGSNQIVDTTTAETLTNKRITARVATLTDASTVTPATDAYDGGYLATLSQSTTIANPTGTPTNNQFYFMYIKSTSSRALSWGTNYEAPSGGALPAATTGSSVIDEIGFTYNSTDSKWVVTSTIPVGNQTITISGDATGSGKTSISVTNTKLNGTTLSGLSTGLMTITTGTGVPGSVSAPSGTVVGTTDTQTLTNKIFTPRVTSLVDASTVTPNIGSYDMEYLASLSQTSTIANPTGTPLEGQLFTLRIKSTTSETLSFGSAYRGATAPGSPTLPTATTGSSLTDYLTFLYNAEDSKWDYVGNSFGH